MYQVREKFVSEMLESGLEERETITIDENGDWVVVYPEPRELEDLVQILNSQ